MKVLRNRTEKPSAPAATGERQSRDDALKTRIHRQLIDRIDLSKLHVLPRELVEQQIRQILEDLLAEDGTPLSRREREQIVLDVQPTAPRKSTWSGAESSSPQM
jgi:hypothetical protein